MVEGIYETEILHIRTKPVKQSFSVRGYSLYIDIERFDRARSGLSLLGFSGVRWHRFRRKDFSLLADSSCSAFECAQKYLRKNSGIRADKIFLLAHPAVAGYIFNPVSFFFCFDAGQHVATVVEVNNTFGEQKHFILPGEAVRVREQKVFYVSPFISAFADFSMKLNEPGEKLDISIDTLAEKHTELVARMRGARYPLSDAQLLKFALKYPLHTLRVIVLIHWYALRLLFRGVPFYPKASTDAAVIHHGLRSHR